MRVYTVVFEAVTLTAAGTDQDLFAITPADDKPVRFLGMTLDNVSGLTDVGDAQEEDVRISVVRGHATVGSGGTAPTPRPLNSQADAASGFTARVNDTTITSAGTATTLLAFGWNVRIGLREFWPEELQPGCSQAETTMVVRMGSTLADDVPASGTLYVAELT